MTENRKGKKIERRGNRKGKEIEKERKQKRKGKDMK